MASRFRLRSSAFVRADEESKKAPKRIIVLSVEGDRTERKYFEHLNEYLDNSLIRIEVLRHRRGDGYSDPRYVIELLNEYVGIREGEIIPEELPSSFSEKYPKEFILKYLKNDVSISPEERKRFGDELLILGIDVEYRKYLKTFTNEGDLFAVLFDRDCGNHSKEFMERCVAMCEEKGYACYISNPCFEFWLLLHLCNIKTELSEDYLWTLLENDKVSHRHTAISQEVSKRAGHAKNISRKIFETKYYPNISAALLQSKEFANSFPSLLDQLGTNIPLLLRELGYSE